MEIWHLDSRGLYGVPPVNNYEQIIRQLIESSPSWEKDGGGIRGRTIAPILSGLPSSGVMNDFGPQQFTQNNNESIQRTASDPIADLILTDRGGGGGTIAPTCIGLNLYVRTVEESQQVWVGAGTVAGEIPLGFDPADGKNIANGGSGLVWAEVNINETTGEIVSVAVEGGSTTTPEDTSTAFYYTLGAYSYDDSMATVTNFGCGSLEFTACRNWFVAAPPYFTADFTR